MVDERLLHGWGAGEEAGLRRRSAELDAQLGLPGPQRRGKPGVCGVDFASLAQPSGGPGSCER
jgi:hypothetical protein